jgi:hypothetical protein
MHRLGILFAFICLFVAAAPASAQEDIEERPRTSPRMDSPMAEKGPCFDEAVRSMPDGPRHDHEDLSQHDFICNLKLEGFIDLGDQLAARPDVMLGESDVKNDIAVVAVAYPEAGILVFDVKDPAKPQFLSWYRAGDCDTQVLDTDCGAYVSLSDDGKMAFLSLQAAAPTGNLSFNGTIPTTLPGVQAISLDNPELPVLVDFLPVAGVNGVHTANYIEIPGSPGADRIPGQYLFINQNGVGVQVARITRQGGVGKLTPVNVIRMDEVHDFFLQNDELDGRTYMYVAAGASSGFYVYDVTNPLEPELKAEWDLEPQCKENWYAHTIDVAVRNGRRYVTMPTEGFSFGTQSGQDESCGVYYGNGDRPGVMWIVDATDFSKLGPADSSDGNEPPNPELAENSKKALVATWHNAANAASGNLKFSPHNNTIVGDRILLSQYHGGLVFLNASGAFAGRNERPYEDALVVPNAGKRPVHQRPQILLGPSISAFFQAPSSLWDVNYYKGYILAYDMHGGMYSYKYEPTRGTAKSTPVPVPQRGGCTDTTGPRLKLGRVKVTRRGVTVSGAADDAGCQGRAGAVSRVSVAISQVRGKKCRHLLPNGRLSGPRACSKPAYRPAKGTSRFTVKIKGKLPRGTYTVFAQAADGAGNVSRASKRKLRVK